MASPPALNLRQLSARCGYSTCTVSRVLSGRAREFRISGETERRILKAAGEAGYRPNYLAHSLNTGRTHTIGLLLANRVDRYLGGILEGVEARLRGTPNRMVVATCENDPELQRQELEAFAYRRVDGMLLYPLAHPGARDPVGRPPPPPFPVVTVGRRGPWVTDEVMLNDGQAGREAARRALASGAHRFLALTNRGGCSSDRARVEAFRAEIARAGGKVRLLHGERLPGRLAPGHAVFAVNSGLLLSLIERLPADAPRQSCWLAVGEIEGQRLFPVPLDTLAMPSRELGRQAADLLLWRLDHPEAPSQRRQVDFLSAAAAPDQKGK